MPLSAQPPEPPPTAPTPLETSLTAERVTVADQVRMGLVGLHALRPITPRWYGGVSVFGAATGDRGGFFGWGLTSGYRLRQGPWQADAGLFIGGGGGSPGWVGGGLMLRPHLALQYDWGPARLGLGVSQLRFPSGTVQATQPFATLGWTGQTFFGPAGGAPDAADAARSKDHAMASETAATFGSYAMRAGSPRRDGSGDAGNLRQAGVVFRRDLPGLWAGSLQPYWLLSAAGSLTASYAGYAELLGGAGLRYALPAVPSLAARAEVAVGSGGAGAAVDTGGGLLAKLLAGLSWQAVPALSVSAMAGQTASRGRFRADELRLELAYRGWDVVPGASRSSASAPGPAALEWAPWALSSSVTRYAGLARDDGSKRSADISALRLERELGPAAPHWRLVGQAGIAVGGNAGGYATGQLGVGWLSAPVGNEGDNGNGGWRFGGEATLGAAGGGGVRVDGGLIGQAQLQARRALSRDWALQADAGWLYGRHGTLSSGLIGVSAVYSFSRLQGTR